MLSEPGSIESCRHPNKVPSVLVFSLNLVIGGKLGDLYSGLPRVQHALQQLGHPARRSEPRPLRDDSSMCFKVRFGAVDLGVEGFGYKVCSARFSEFSGPKKV